MSAPIFELAWAAGFFDGEGSAFCKVKPPRPETPGGFASLGVSMKQVRREPLDRFVAAVGVGNVRGPYQVKNPNGQPIFEWGVSGAPADLVLAGLWPFLSDPKREQVVTARKAVAGWWKEKV